MTEIQTINEKDDINSIIKKLQREDINYCAVIDDNENFL
jgi:CBS domain-containing protein